MPNVTFLWQISQRIHSVLGSNNHVHWIEETIMKKIEILENQLNKDIWMQSTIEDMMPAHSHLCLRYILPNKLEKLPFLFHTLQWPCWLCFSKAAFLQETCNELCNFNLTNWIPNLMKGRYYNLISARLSSYFTPRSCWHHGLTCIQSFLLDTRAVCPENSRMLPSIMNGILESVTWRFCWVSQS